MSRTDPASEEGTLAHVEEDGVETVERVRGLSRLLDESIELPGGYHIGLDPLVGLVPVVGDVPASAVSTYIVMEAAYLGVPKATLARMVLNVAVDTVFGSVPLVGPVFDAAWKANARNVALLEARLEEPRTARTDRRLLYGLAAALLVAVLALSLAVGAAAAWLAGELGLF